ncbi:RecQ family ATP-dependent DNA helicase [Agarilytica rhodophyticola]|uniref:RecQ family ATP-dependent DNA helicase n=1 Tax=Agarilytica rhodophyticola TaxID=1737490 RepID=UPI000B348A79|nr:RecQ family ATP-dependent DNA helicase [Agarilytica rhodophyticola]
MSAASINNLDHLLKENFGFDDFREGQKPVIEKLLAGQSSLAIFPTGSGKSLCYQLTATQLPHLTLVVSPLLALMKDQLAFLHKHSIKAASLDSSLDYDEYNKVVNDIRNNTLKILMVSVERFKNERFRLLIENTKISLLVIDEAHCISEWGHNFRPDYLKLPRYQNDLTIPQVLLLTATATQQVKMDMMAKFSITQDAVIQTGFYRDNLHLNVLPVSESDKPQLLVNLIERQGAGCGIVYVTLQQTAESIAKYLTNAGLNAKAYHAGMNNDARKQVQDEFMSGATPVVVATIAFGMGVDKSDIRFVIHYDLPKSIENYSQEIGRAGRDGETSHCYVLGNLATLNTLENFVYGDTPELWSIQFVIDAIKAVKEGYWETQLYSLSYQSNIRQLTLKTLLVKLEMVGVITPKYSYSAEYSVKLLMDQKTIINYFDAERKQFVSALLDAIVFKKMWGTVDFDRLFNSYGGERKRAITALEYMRDKQWLELKSSGTTEVFSVDTSLLHQPQLAETLYQQFKQHEQSEINRINKLLKFLQSTRCLSYDLARYFDDLNAPKHCGHCSVCQGNVAILLAPGNDNVIPKNQLYSIATTLKEYLLKANVTHCSNDLIARYLVGINVPVFTSTKAKKNVTGFAIAETMRYQDVIDFLDSAL